MNSVKAGLVGLVWSVLSVGSVDATEYSGNVDAVRYDTLTGEPRLSMSISNSDNVCGNSWFAIQGVDETQLSMVRSAQYEGQELHVVGDGACDSFGVETALVLTVTNQ
jgi:hypothetical protein